MKVNVQVNFPHALGGETIDINDMTISMADITTGGCDASSGVCTYELTVDTSRAACVQTLEKSAQLNRLFRRIPATDDIDRQELSEDEETFENVAPNRHLAGSDIPMECIYAERFHKWIPVRPTTERTWSNTEVSKLEPVPRVSADRP